MWRGSEPGNTGLRLMIREQEDIDIVLLSVLVSLLLCSSGSLVRCLLAAFSECSHFVPFECRRAFIAAPAHPKRLFSLSAFSQHSLSFMASLTVSRLALYLRTSWDRLLCLLYSPTPCSAFAISPSQPPSAKSIGGGFLVTFQICCRSGGGLAGCFKHHF